MVPAAAGGQTLDDLSFDKKLKLAKAGNQRAQVAVAQAYDAGSEVKVSKVEAAKWYRKAADQGDSEAMFRLAHILSEGAPGIKKSPELAVKFYESAARQGHAEAQNGLGYSYQRGLGVQQSDASAVGWYKKAADAGLAVAQNNLGLMYLNGNGVRRDYNKAFALFDHAAKQGDAWGMNNLGGLYEMGWGVKQDRQKALRYYRQAFETGNKRAGENMKRLSTVLGSGETTASTAPSPAAPERENTGERKPSPKTEEKPKVIDSAVTAIVGPQPPVPRPKPLPSRQQKEKFAGSNTKAQTEVTSSAEQPPAPTNKHQKTLEDSGTCPSIRFRNFAAGRMHPCDYF